MLALLGIVAVFAAVIGGFVLERGNLYILLQPSEFLIVAGAAIGSVMIANTPSVIRKMGHGIALAFRKGARTPKVYLDHMRMLYEVFVYVQRAGVIDLETDIEDPPKSRIFSNYPHFLADRTTRDLVCDSLRMLVLGVTSPHELDRLLNLDIEVQGRGRHEPVNALGSVADALPGLGIIAAVLGVVITMSRSRGRPRRSVKRSLRLSSERSSACCCATDWWARWPRDWRHSTTRSRSFNRCSASPL